MAQLFTQKRTLPEITLSAAASAMLILSLLLPWWRIQSDIGGVSAPLWSSAPLQSWMPLAGEVRPDWYLIMPVFVGALVALLLSSTSWKESLALYALVSIIVPWELTSAQGVMLGYFSTYFAAISAGYSSGVGYFTATPSTGIILYLAAYAIMTILLTFKLVTNNRAALGRLRIVSILVVFSGFYWYLIGSLSFWENPSWVWVMTLDTAFIVTTGILLWSSHHYGWLSLGTAWKDKLQLLFLPILVFLDAITTNYALPASGFTSPLGSSGTSIRDASLLVNSVQASGLIQVVYLFWTLLLLQVLALSYLTLGLASNKRLRSFPRFLACYALNMMIAAYAFTVSNNVMLILTGRTWFASSEALVLMIALAVTLAFLSSISTVWGFTRLADLKRDWQVRF